MAAPALPGPLLVSGGGGSDVDGPEDVVGENGKGHFGSGSFQCPGQETSTGRHSLDGAEGLFDGTSPGFHCLGRGAGIHAVECIVV